MFFLLYRHTDKYKGVLYRAEEIWLFHIYCEMSPLDKLFGDSLETPQGWKSGKGKSS